MATERFRHQLREEATQWCTDGLISDEQFAQLAEVYRFDDLETSARDRFILILMGLGCVLLGLGVITFVAANWQAIPRYLKLGLLLLAFLGVSLAGFWLWRFPRRQPGDRSTWHHRLGEGLLVLGSLLMGAALALGGQLFHVGGDIYELYWMWGLGVLAMALGLGLVPLGLLAILLMGLAYWLGFFNIERWSGVPGLPMIMATMPLLGSIGFTVLAYRCQSRLIFGLGALATLSSFSVTTVQLSESVPDASAFFGPLVACLPIALLWGFSDELWYAIARRPTPPRYPFRPIAQAMALLYLGAACYLLSFYRIWGNFGDRPSILTQFATWFGEGRSLWLNPTILGLSVLTIAGWIFLARPTPHRRRWRLTSTDSQLLLLISILGGLLFWHIGLSPIPRIATLLVNVILALLGAGLIRQGLAQTNRFIFWCGLLTLTLQILSRLFEYDTGLLLKSLAFVLCGLGIMVVGFWFERYVRTLNPSVSSASTEEPP